MQEAEKPEVTHGTTAVTSVHPSLVVSETGLQEMALKDKQLQGWGEGWAAQCLASVSQPPHEHRKARWGREGA